MPPSAVRHVVARHRTTGLVLVARVEQDFITAVAGPLSSGSLPDSRVLGSLDFRRNSVMDHLAANIRAYDLWQRYRRPDGRRRLITAGSSGSPRGAVGQADSGGMLVPLGAAMVAVPSACGASTAWSAPSRRSQRSPCMVWNHAIVKLHGNNATERTYNVWTTLQHEMSHFFGAPDRYPDTGNNHADDVMENQYSYPDWWCSQAGYNDRGIIKSHVAKYD